MDTATDAATAVAAPIASAAAPLTHVLGDALDGVTKSIPVSSRSRIYTTCTMRSHTTPMSAVVGVSVVGVSFCICSLLARLTDDEGY